MPSSIPKMYKVELTCISCHSKMSIRTQIGIKCACLLSRDGNFILHCSPEKDSYEERGECGWKGRRFFPCLMDSPLSG